MESEAVDGDKLCEQALERQLQSLHMSSEDVKKARAKKQYKENLYVYQHIIANRLWESDPSCNFVDAHLLLSIALDGLGRRGEAIRALRDAHRKWPEECKLSLALAKLLFRDDKMPQAFNILRECILEQIDGVDHDIASDAYYLAGWIKIHGDDHTQAYKLWSQGHTLLPSSSLLARQHQKRKCWDSTWNLKDSNKTNLVGKGHHGDGYYNVDSDLISYRVRDCSPALALFDAEEQKGNLIFRSRYPVLTKEECKNVLRVVDEHHQENSQGVWGTVRKSSVKTTDVAVEDIPILRGWLLELLHTRLFPMLSFAFPRLVDGSTVVDPVSRESRVRVHDAFIVRYDADKDKSFSLPGHRDTSAMSFSIALNSNTEYEGGGTWFEALEVGDSGSGSGDQVINCDVGEAVAFAGPLRHGGHPVVKGVRTILVLFLYVNDFTYGEYLQKATVENSCNPNNQDNTDSSAGYVVYKQTVELVNMLENPLVGT
eukprot:CAMPEP_0204837128 /NCGR_PEP_ID=MMETSP1346-20131115/27232_1 /ASSEMBLY_ACC=CAM_ASM_000771 /TAXON_ID=215587 /ORGANISM="Aplanochytrium stocchinoi, Strain GSBS06" /LENGTH=484 /DNA_ID=CAMNT_0051972411 /DNA_START=133 /DNA_END=1587 /DNA_ORIENTATION=+